MASPMQQTNSGLFNLPGELRNRIYRLVLVEGVDEVHGYIEYTNTGYDRPGLLNTCKAVRLEARTIFYYENNFFTTPTKYDSTTLLAWRQHLPTLGIATKGIKARIRMLWGSEANWPNLMIWLQRFHAEDVTIPALSMAKISGHVQSKVNHYIIAGLFESAKKLRDQPWIVAEGVLVQQRPVLGFLDTRWNENSNERQ
ncbi:hypothetical protein DOTSEDRAFT_53774 [Dothistroma septosporum NZE10]|uniref:Uncharacterized protein n=1 Tax=Dothistroma septosporum (strain NZE10 / CBS 128990) TaxID=675120 RepID=N1PR04_DOTSN|nr:hypothetical protein DOTSEDRAFT_53774 [Dothistroma septosporum NZE10]